MLDQTKFRLVPLEGVGRVGIQPKSFDLGTSDDEATLITAGYLDTLIDVNVSLNSRLLFDGDLVYARSGIGSASPKWGSYEVSYDESGDTYTLVPVNLAPGGDTTSYISMQVPVELTAVSGNQVDLKFPQTVTLKTLTAVNYKNIVGSVGVSCSKNGGPPFASGTFDGPKLANTIIEFDLLGAQIEIGDYLSVIVTNAVIEDTLILTSVFYT